MRHVGAAADRHPDPAARPFLRYAQSVGPAHFHLSLRAISGCHAPAFAAVPPPLPMCRESFERDDAQARSASAARLEMEVRVERFLVQCAAHANDEYLVSLFHSPAMQQSCQSALSSQHLVDETHVSG
jgi:hypothetical protein